MLVSIVVPEKLSGQKGVTKKQKKKNMNFWAFLTSFYSNPDMNICNFLMSVCSSSGVEHTDTNI